LAAVRDIKLEPASPVDGDESPTAMLKFDVYNEVDLSIAGVVVSVSVLGESSGLTPEVRPVLVRPFKIRVSQVLQPGYSVHYELRMKNISADCDCLPRVEVVEARIVEELEIDSALSRD